MAQKTKKPPGVKVAAAAETLHSIPLIRPTDPATMVESALANEMALPDQTTAQVAPQAESLPATEMPKATYPVTEQAPEPQATEQVFQTTEQGKEAPQGTKSDLDRLEGIVAEGVKKHREAIEALMTIRDRKLYRLTAAETDIAEWPADGYDTFDAYAEGRWSRTRQWVTQEVNWLRACKCLEAAGKAPYQFSKQAVQPAAYLLERDPEGFCEVYLDAAAMSLPVTEEAMKKSLKAYQQFGLLREEWNRREESAKVPDSERVPLAKNEAALLNFPWEHRSYSTNLVDKAKDKAKETGRTWQLCLPEVCEDERKLPMPTHLLDAVRGDDLKEVVPPLQALSTKWLAQDQAAKEADELSEKAREIRRKHGIKPKSKKPKEPAPGDGDEDTAGDGEDAAEKESIPEPAKMVTAMEQSWETEFTVAYLLLAGVQCWEVAFERLDPTDKEAVLEANKQMTELIEKFKEVFPS